ncbi:hypothetical protein [Lysinibacillus capsici]|uniref:hypothetical protein n=1 Tax=Lysinibacillus capsici TaxID=2115968 RepID=UPI00325FDC01
MSNIRNLCSEGFAIPDINANFESIALISLKQALKSYFSTYKYMANNGRSLFEDELDARSHSPGYIEHYSETIIHFQHFFELICKDILRKENELLVLNIDNKHEIFYNLIKGEEVPNDELEKINTIEFNRTFERLCNLISNDKLDPKYSFFKDSNKKIALEQLNIMRNRIWHRGSFVMKYKSLDLFVGKYILPIVKEIINLPEYCSLSRLWEYRGLEAKINPLDEIISVCNEQAPALDHIAFLKELGRAAYNNPYNHDFGFFKKEIADRAIKIARAEIPDQIYGDDYIISCPVCGTKSLVKYEESDGDMDESGQYTSYWTWINNIKCYCCSFELRSSGMRNPSEYGYSLPDFWYEYEH